MATSTEEILIRMGLNSDGVKSGMNRMMDEQKRSANEYVSFWKRAIDQKEEIETRAAVEGASRRNRARQLMREREIEQAKRHAAKMAEVEAGYTPESWKQRAALNSKYSKYGFEPRVGPGGMAGMNVASEATDGLLSGKESGKLGKDIASAAIEGGVFAIIYEVLKSAFKISAKNLGKNILGAIPKGVGGVALPATIAGYFINDTGKKAVEAGKQELESNQWKIQDWRPLYGAMIGKALNEGRISFEQAKRLRGDGKNYGGTLDGLGFSSDNKNANYYEGMSFADVLNFNKAEKAAEKAAAERKKYLSDYEYETSAQNHIRRRLYSRRSAMQDQVDAHNFNTVSISDIAGRDWSAEIATLYGEGGARDLGSGKGRLANVAREFEKSRYEQMWQRMNGNKNAADAAKERMNSMEKILVDYGAQSPTMDIAAMRKGIDSMDLKLNDLKVKIKDVEE